MIQIGEAMRMGLHGAENGKVTDPGTFWPLSAGTCTALTGSLCLSGGHARRESGKSRRRAFSDR